jgi:hypothetical protein
VLTVTDEPITDEMVEAKWTEIAPLIDVMTRRIQTPSEFAVQPNSELAADDAATNPYQLSHTARWCLNAGVDHLTHSNRSSSTLVASTHTLRTASFAAPLKT